MGSATGIDMLVVSLQYHIQELPFAASAVIGSLLHGEGHLAFGWSACLCWLDVA